MQRKPETDAMTLRPDDDAALTLLLAARGLGPVSLRRLRRHASLQGRRLRDLLAVDARALARAANLPSQALTALKSLRSPEKDAQTFLKRIEAARLNWTIEGQDGYPGSLSEALGEDAPVVLFGRGNFGLLTEDLVAVVGSREPRAASRDFTSALCRRLVAAGFGVVSGGARGIDSAAHAAALGSGTSVMVLPVGALNQSKTPALIDLAPRIGESLCVISQFPPDADWESGQAILRNRVIVALAKWVVAADPRDFGGTWSSATTALDLRRPLFVVSDQSHAVRRRALGKLVRAGAIPLELGSVPDVDRLRALAAQFSSAPMPVQSRLFGP